MYNYQYSVLPLEVLVLIRKTNKNVPNNLVTVSGSYFQLQYAISNLEINDMNFESTEQVHHVLHGNSSVIWRIVHRIYNHSIFLIKTSRICAWIYLKDVKQDRAATTNLVKLLNNSTRKAQFYAFMFFF